MPDNLELTSEEQRLLDQMRADDAQPAQEPIAPQAEPEEQPAEPVQQPAPAQPAQPQQRDDRVPYAALSEERQRRQRAEEQIRTLEERNKIIEERTNLLLQRFNQPQPQTQGEPEAPKPPPIPDLDKDPVGHIIGNQVDMRQQLQTAQQQARQWQEQLQQQTQAQQILNYVTQTAQGLERMFIAEHPDYSNAIDHLRRSRHREMEIVGITDPGQREQIIAQEGMGIAVRAINERRNPAEQLYELARMRGYQPPASPQPNGMNGVLDAPTHAAEAPQAQPNAPAGGQVPTAQQRLQTLQEGQNQARSLGAARGGGPVPLTAQRLIEMSPEEFDKALQTAEGMALLGA